MSKTVIIGGGITGLTAALFSKLKNPKSEVILLESTDRLGGWVRSKRFTDGSIHELGPRTIRMQVPTINPLLSIIDKLNINNKIISISKTNKNFLKRYIYAHDKLHLLDLSLLKPAQTPFTESMLRKVVRAGLKKYEHENNFQDLPVDHFFRTRFGDEIADYMINPIVRGIYACDSRDLSMQSTFGGIFNFEKEGPNVVIAALRNYLFTTLRGHVASTQGQSEELTKQIKDASVISFKGGLQTLIDGISKTAIDLDVNIQTGSLVTNVKSSVCGKLNVQLTNSSIICDRLICAVPSYVAKSIISGFSNEINILGNIQWTSVAVVVLEYKGRLITNSGFGHLIPSWVTPDVLGVLYDSCILPENDNSNEMTTRYTVMLGGSWFSPRISAMDVGQMTKMAAEVLLGQMKVGGLLLRSTVAVNHNCIPVYGLKHGDLVTAVRQAIETKYPIRLCGNSYDGVSLSDCVNSAHNAVQSFGS